MIAVTALCVVAGTGIYFRVVRPVLRGLGLDL